MVNKQEILLVLGEKINQTKSFISVKNIVFEEIFDKQNDLLIEICQICDSEIPDLQQIYKLGLIVIELCYMIEDMIHHKDTSSFIESTILN